jgi:hypothetical protein
MDGEVFVTAFLTLVGCVLALYGFLIIRITMRFRSEGGLAARLFPIRGFLVFFAGVAFLLSAASVAPRLMIGLAAVLFLIDPLVRQIALRLDKTPPT